MLRIMVVDNYDSFTYNLVHILKELNQGPVDVYKNDEASLEEISKYDKILISPGPGIPDEAGITKEIVSYFASSKSIFGICLGCQAIAECFGGTLINLNKVYHGVETEIEILEKDEKLFIGIPQKFNAGRYHSWVVDGKSLPSELRITAIDNKGMVMALSHIAFDIRAVQFHPESIMTKFGRKIMENWIKI